MKGTVLSARSLIMTIAAANTDIAKRPGPPVALAPDDTHVDAQMTYLADTAVKPVTYNPPPGTGEQRRVGNYGSFRVRIHDARPIAASLDLDREGFVLRRHDTAMRDFYDEREVRDVYYQEVER